MDIKINSDFFDYYVTTTFDIAYALSKALDLVNPMINNHHQRVAFIAGSIAKECGLTDDRIEQIILASLIHDIGVVMEDEFQELSEYDVQRQENEMCHAVVGAQLMAHMKLFKNIPPLIKYHHTPFNAKTNLLAESPDEKVPDDAYIIHLADRIDVLLDREMSCLDQKDDVKENINRFSGITFSPEHVEAFIRLADKEYFWFDIEETEKYKLLKFGFSFSHLGMDTDNMLETARLLSRIIDFRCVFTANHSAGVAAVAGTIGGLMGLGDNDRKALMIAGYLHDIGKLAVPADVLYKQGELEPDEMVTLLKHPYYTYSILNNFQIFDKIKDWAAFHHENLDGSGYPFHLKADRLDMGCRILAVSDVFTALTENRPYRLSLGLNDATDIIRGMVKNNKLDADIAYIVMDNFDMINDARETSQKQELIEFDKFKNVLLSNTICNKNKRFISTLC